MSSRMIKNLNADTFTDTVERTCNALEDFLTERKIEARAAALLQKLLPLLAQTAFDDAENNGDPQQALRSFASLADKGKVKAVQLFRDWQYARAHKASIRAYEAQLPGAQKPDSGPAIARLDRLALIGIAVAVWVGNGNDIMDLPQQLQAWLNSHPEIQDFMRNLMDIPRPQLLPLPEPGPL